MQPAKSLQPHHRFINPHNAFDMPFLQIPVKGIEAFLDVNALQLVLINSHQQVIILIFSTETAHLINSDLIKHFPAQHQRSMNVGGIIQEAQAGRAKRHFSGIINFAVSPVQIAVRPNQTHTWMIVQIVDLLGKTSRFRIIIGILPGNVQSICMLNAAI